MFKTKKKNLWIYALIAMTIYFAYFYYKASMDHIVYLKEEKIYTEKINQEKEKGKKLDKKAAEANSKEVIEDLARNDLNYLKDDEILFIDGEKTE